MEGAIGPARARRLRVTAALAVALTALGVAGVVVATTRHSSAPELIPLRAMDVDGVVIDLERRRAADPAGDGTAVCAPVSLAVTGAAEGVRDGVRGAVARHNSANAGCQVQLKDVPTDGRADGGFPALEAAFADAYTIGLIADEPPGAVDAGVPVAVVASAGAPGPSTYTAAATPADGAEAVGAWLRGDVSRVCVLDDGSAAAAALVRPVVARLGDVAVPGCGGADASSDALAAARPDAVVYGGGVGPAADAARSVAAGSPAARLVLLDGAHAAQVVDAAGSTSLHTVAVRADGPAPAGYASSSAAVAYDLATVMLRGIDAGALTREELDRWMGTYDGVGVTGDMVWRPDGRPARPTVWLWEVR